MQVQCDHFENFFEPELKKLGYSVMYKKKTGAGVWLKSDLITFIHLCRTFVLNINLLEGWMIYNLKKRSISMLLK